MGVRFLRKALSSLSSSSSSSIIDISTMFNYKPSYALLSTVIANSLYHQTTLNYSVLAISITTITACASIIIKTFLSFFLSFYSTTQHNTTTHNKIIHIYQLPVVITFLIIPFNKFKSSHKYIIICQLINTFYFPYHIKSYLCFYLHT